MSTTGSDQTPDDRANENAPDQASVSLRARLREDTRGPHDRLDALAESLDFSTLRDLLAFIGANSLAYDALSGFSPETDALLGARLARAKMVFADAGSDLPVAKLPVISAEIERVGLTYVVVGSSMGAKLIAQQCRSSDDQKVRMLSSHLLDPALDQRWRELTMQLRAMPGDDAMADRIVASAVACFRVFQHSFEHVLAKRGGKDSVR